MTTAGPDGIRHTDTIKTRATYASPTERTEGTDWSGWEHWMQGHKDLLLDHVDGALVQIVEDLEKKIKTLELGLAQANGALDVLRGKGIPGTFNIKGTFDARSVYNRLDVVAFNGASWVAKEDRPGDLPGPNWQLLSAAGKRGVAGERGPPGPAGPAPRWTGAQFSHRGMEIETSAGPIPLFKSVNVDRESFAIRFIAADDSTLTISLLPLFEEFQRQTTSR
jgi:hypothetical protein